MRARPSQVIGWILFGLLLALLIIPQPDSENISSWLLFLGRFHPAFLHLPIGLFAAVIIAELVGRYSPDSVKPVALRCLLAAAFYGATVTAIFGVLLSWEGGYPEDTLSWHKWGGALFAALLFAGFELRSRVETLKAKTSSFYFGSLGLAAITMFATGHDGGSLTHGSNYLTEHNPFKAKEEVAAVDLATMPVYDRVIAPMMKDYCVQCHGPDKIKGELRLDSYEGLMKGGESDEALVPGDSKYSLMIEQIHYDLDDEDHMPPEGKPQLTEEMVKVLEWWIDQGASPTATLEELSPSAETTALLAKTELQLKIKPPADPEATGEDDNSL